MREVSPLVSIVTPSYNHSRFLEETLLSIKGQDYPNFEHIVMDGGSTDESQDILRKFEGTYPMQWFSEPDRGQADAISKGFRLANGDILAWLNSDDVFLPGAISRVVGEFQREPDVDLFYGDVLVIDECGQIIQDRVLTRVDQHDFLGLGNCLAQPATFWTRRIYDAVGGVDPQYYYQMDLDFYIRVAAKGQMKHLDAYLAKIRMHPAGKMSKAEHVRRQELSDLRERYLPRGARGIAYNRYLLLARLFGRHVLQGHWAYLSRVARRRSRI